MPRKFIASTLPAGARLEAMAYSIPLFALNYDEQEQKAVLDVLRSGWISMGPKTAELETAFSAHVGCPYAIAVSKCTPPCICVWPL